VTADHSRDNLDAELRQLKRQYPRWLIWRGRTTSDYWAIPPRGHPGACELICARDIRDLADRIAQADRRPSS
jgi:hypothetical protein